MITKKDNIIAVVCAAIIVAMIGIILSLAQVAPKSYGDSSYPNSFSKTSTSSQETVTGTNEDVLATSTSRLWSMISNVSTNGTSVFCTYNGKPATSQGGMVVNASSTLIINQDGLYTGSVNCISQGGTATLWVESVQS